LPDCFFRALLLPRDAKQSSDWVDAKQAASVGGLASARLHRLLVPIRWFSLQLTVLSGGIMENIEQVLPKVGVEVAMHSFGCMLRFARNQRSNKQRSAIAQAKLLRSESNNKSRVRTSVHPMAEQNTMWTKVTWQSCGNPETMVLSGEKQQGGALLVGGSVGTLLHQNVDGGTSLVDMSQTLDHGSVWKKAAGVDC